MRATNKKNLLIGLTATLACGSLALGLALAKPATITPAYAETTETAAFSSTGTQLDAQNAQIRFNATLTADEYAKYFDENGAAKEGTQTGMLILPLDVYESIDGATGLNLETYEAHDDVVQNVDTTNLWEINEDGAYEAWAKLDGEIIGEGNYNRALLYVCYVTDGETPQYTEEQKTSMSYEAMLAQSFDIDETYKTALADTYMLDYEVTFNDAYARTMTVEYGTKVSDMTSRDVSQLYWDANFTNQVAESDYITCDSTVYIKEENQNSDELLSFDYAVDTTKDGVRQDNPNASDYTVDWLPEFEGENGVVSMEYCHYATGVWAPKFTVYPRQSVALDSTIYTDYKYVVLRMYIVKDDTYESDWSYIAVNSQDSTGCKYTLNDYDYNKWIDIKFELSDIKASLENFDPTYGKGLQIYGQYGTSDTIDGTEKGRFYVSDMYLEKGSDEVIQLTGANYKKYTKLYKSGTTFTWSQYHNALQVENTGEKTYFGVSLQGLWDYEEVKASYDYFTCEVYWPTNAIVDYDGTTVTTTSAHMRCAASTSTALTMRIANTGGKEASSGTQNQWFKVMLPIDGLQYTSLAVYQQSSSASTRMYIRNIELKKADITLNIENEDNLVAGEKINVTATDSEGVATELKSVYAARYINGNVVSNLTPTLGGDWYLVAVTEDGRLGYKKVTVKVELNVTGTLQVGETLSISLNGASTTEIYNKKITGGANNSISLSVVDGDGNAVTITQAAKGDLPTFIPETAGKYTVTCIFGSQTITHTVEVTEPVA